MAENITRLVIHVKRENRHSGAGSKFAEMVNLLSMDAVRKFPQNNVRKFRHEAGLTLEKLGELAGTTGQTVSRIELGKRGINQWLEPLAIALGKRPSELIYEVADISTPPSRREFAQNTDEARILIAWRAFTRREQAIIKKLFRKLGANGSTTA